MTPVTCGAVILSGGRSSRMGSAKALLAFEGDTFLAIIASRLAGAWIERPVVVTGSHDAPIRGALPPGVTAVTNPDPDRGMLSSAQIGVIEVLMRSPAVTGVMICLVDHPAVRVATYRLLLEEHGARPEAILIPRHADRNGHPLLLPASLFPDLLGRAPTEEMRAIVRAHPDRIRRLDVDDPGILIDIDTPADLARLPP